MFDQLREIIATKFQLDANDIVPGCTLKDLELDSLDTVELSLAIEKEFGTKVSDDELTEVQQVDLIARLIESKSATV